jgi:hypothetical protein
MLPGTEFLSSISGATFPNSPSQKIAKSQKLLATFEEADFQS